LSGEIDDAQTTATVDSAGVTFRAAKKTPGLWGKLAVEGLSKEQRQARRDASVEAAHARLEVRSPRPAPPSLPPGRTSGRRAPLPPALPPPPGAHEKAGWDGPSQAARKLKLDERKRYEKDLTHQTFDIESAKRSEIERLKALELEAERARVGLGGTIGGDDESGDEEEPLALAAADQPMPDHPDYHGRGWRKDYGEGGEEGEKEQWGEKHIVRVMGDSDEEAPGGGGEQPVATRKVVEAAPFRPLPPPRLKAEPVKVDFTALQMAHLPAREKREAEIADYRRKQQGGGARLDEPNDIAERQPMFLKDKGDSLFGKGNLEAALHAYSRAIELDDRLAVLHANRAACHLKMGMFQHCVTDCNRALELSSPAAAAATGEGAAAPGPSAGSGVAAANGGLDITLPGAPGDVTLPQVDTEKPAAAEDKAAAIVAEEAAARAAAKTHRMRVKVLCRRAKALAAIGDVRGSLADLEEASKMEPNNPEITRAIEDAQLSQGAQDVPTVMEFGNRRFKEGDFEGAAEAFGCAARMAAGHGMSEATALTARAAALLQLNRFRAAEEDCTEACRVLVGVAKAEDAGAAVGIDYAGDAVSVLWSLGVPQRWGSGATREGQTLTKAVGRRAVALGHMKEYERARGDFAALAELYRLGGLTDKATAAERDAENMASMMRGAIAPAAS